jgi:hypothetical protein
MAPMRGPTVVDGDTGDGDTGDDDWAEGAEPALGDATVVTPTIVVTPTTVVDGGESDEQPAPRKSPAATATAASRPC